ncbi:MAG: 2-dehydropantoate 2-reductase [Actinomycetota bacterium]
MRSSVRSAGVIGPGAIGGAIAGALVEADSSGVLVAARTGFDRLVVDHPNGRIDHQVPVLTDPGETTEPLDLVIVAVKAHQTEGAGRWLGSLVGPDTTVVVAQNGVEHLARVAPFVPDGTDVVPAVIWCPAKRPAPGRIEVTGRARLVVPEGPGGARLADRLAGSFFEIRQTDDWQSRAWDKLLINAALGGLGVLTGRAGRDLCDDPDLADLLERLMAEAAEVGRAEGAVIAEDRPAVLIAGMAAAGAHLSSIVVDRLAGVPTEWDARNAVVGRLAERHGIDVPLNRWITALVRAGEPQHPPEREPESPVSGAA